MLTAIDVRKLHDKAFVHGQTTREKGADDLLFYWVTHWDDTTLNTATLQYRGQFDMLRKAGRQIMADVKSNPVQVDFEPADDTDDSAADIIDGMYRSSMRSNESMEGRGNALTETIVCGYGAWELYTKYKSNSKGDKKQIVSRRPLFEANNQVMWDPNAKLADKSDAEYVSCLIAYSEDGYKDLVLDLTGEKINGVAASFAFPEHSYVFPWLLGNDNIYVTRFYHRTKKKCKVLFFSDDFGSEKKVKDYELSEHEDEMFDKGFSCHDEKEIEEYQVTLYIVGGGDEVLASYTIPGGEIPVVPIYGERAFVEGEETYQGITRLAKDPQRLRNFQLSYLADIVSRSPRTKPIFFPEQVQSFEWMYEDNGADNNLPYVLQNMSDANGHPLPLGAQGVLPEQPVPQALIASIQATREAINDVAAEGLPQNITDLDLSGEALSQVQKLFDKQSFIYQEGLKTALRRDGQVYAAMAAEVYDEEQEIVMIKPDNSRQVETINQEEIDLDTLRLVVNNDVKNFSFEVYSDIGPSYQSVKEQNRKELKELINTEPPDSPMRSMMLLEYMTMQDGVAFEGLRDYARKQLIIQGYKEPETDEEKQMMMQMQQNQQPDPNAMLAEAEAQARMMEGQAALQNEQNDAASNQINAYKAETDRKKVEIQAAEAGVTIDMNTARAQGYKIDNVLKVTGQQLRRA